MHMREYQTWLQAYDVARGWDQIAPSHTFMHLIEEVGEIAREVEVLEGYREAPDRDDARARLAGGQTGVGIAFRPFVSPTCLDVTPAEAGVYGRSFGVRKLACASFRGSNRPARVGAALHRGKGWMPASAGMTAVGGQAGGGRRERRPGVD